MIKINKAGYIYTILTILIGFSAINTGNNLVYIIASALLSYMLVSGIFGRKNIYQVDVVPEFPDEIYAGVDTPTRVRVVNKGRFLPVFLIRVDLERQKVFFPFVRAASEAALHVSLRFEARGLHEVDAIRISSFFPFNLFTRYRQIRKAFSVLVFPAPLPFEMTQLGPRHARFKGDASSNSPGYDSDVLAIRDYVSGDPMKYISWKSTAKTGHLKTKELSSIELESVMIDFDRMEKINLEQALSQMTFLVLRLMRSNVPVGMVIGGETFQPGTSNHHKLKILAKLALYGSS